MAVWFAEQVMQHTTILKTLTGYLLILHLPLAIALKSEINQDLQSILLSFPIPISA